MVELIIKQAVSDIKIGATIEFLGSEMRVFRLKKDRILVKTIIYPIRVIAVSKYINKDTLEPRYVNVIQRL